MIKKVFFIFRKTKLQLKNECVRPIWLLEMQQGMRMTKKNRSWPTLYTDFMQLVLSLDRELSFNTQRRQVHMYLMRARAGSIGTGIKRKS
jgi:hypothetical protein